MNGENVAALEACRTLTEALSRTKGLESIYTVALDALARGLSVRRSSILLFDPDGVMRFKASRGLSGRYTQAVEGHSPWSPGATDAKPIVVSDTAMDESLAPHQSVIAAEGIAAMTFIPLISHGRVIGKFMLYYERAYTPSEAELALAAIIASQVAFAVERTRTEQSARDSEARLRLALDAALMGTWEWELTTNRVRWSDSLEWVHGLTPGTFDGTFESYERQILAEDRDHVASVMRHALEHGTPFDLDYRVVGADGRHRWIEGKGLVEVRDGRPVRITGVCVDVTRRKEAELARIEAAEDAGRLKDEFLATLSHELRTPLNAIVGWIQLLRADSLSPERAQRAIDVIDRNARRQASLIEDILDVSRMITGKLDLKRRTLSLGPILEHALDSVRPMALAKQIEIEASIQPNLPTVHGDQRRLEQVFTNLLSNAIKFTPEHGRVTIASSASDDDVAIDVRDTGMGIPPEFLPHVFERFRQADSSTTRQYGGLGLGLAIARTLVEGHGGTIRVIAHGVQQGTTFRVVLPTAHRRLTKKS